MFLKMKSFKSFTKSFVYAFRGILYCIRNERNMRIHISAAVFIAAFSFVYGLTSAEYAILFLTTGFVIVAEMFNTATEVAINLEMPSYHNLAKIGKDVAAGAVFVSAITSVTVGLFLFLHFPKLTDTLLKIVTDKTLAVIFGLLTILGLLFSFGFKKIKCKG